MRRLLLVALALTVLRPAVALAHEDTGRFERVRVEVIDPLTLSVKATLIYPNDGEPAEEATVTAVAEQPGAPASAPSPLDELAPGEYSTELTVPNGGSWTVRLTALSPSATTETTVEVPEPATTTTAETSTTRQSAASTSEAPAQLGTDTGDGGSATLALVAGLGVAVVAILVAWRTIAARRRATEG